MAVRKAGLGRNLNVFLSNTKKIHEGKSKVALDTLSVDCLQAGAFQPRRDMSQEALNELAESIKQQGLIQPIVVRKLKDEPGRYEIIAGERRWRASKQAKLMEIPVVIHDVDDKTCLAMAIIENIQRENLNPIDEARALSRLINEFDLTHQQAADIVSKSRASVSNLLRLMNLHKDVQIMLERGDLEMGHARALLALDKPKQIIVARQVVAKGYTVRETEAAIRRALMSEITDDNDELLQTHQQHADLRQDQLGKHLGVKVKIKPSRSGKFKVELSYDSLERLDAFVDRCLPE
tara:strand:- start:165 stop:1043 length:879 start_codon:yes stop_codon:yes gene_type:complete